MSDYQDPNQPQNQQNQQGGYPPQNPSQEGSYNQPPPNGYAQQPDGYNQQAGGYAQQPNVVELPKAEGYTLGLVSMILGIIGFVFGCCMGGFVLIFSLPALVLGIMVMTKNKGMTVKGKGFAITGLILGILGTLWGLFAIISMILFSVFNMDSMFNNMFEDILSDFNMDSYY